MHSRDYRSIPHLDTYDGEGLDQADYDAMSPGARAAAEIELRKRDRQDALASGRMRPGLLYEESEDDDLGPSQPRRRRGAGDRTADQSMDFEQVRYIVVYLLFKKSAWNVHGAEVHIL